MAKKNVTIGKLRTPPIGDEAVLVSLTVRTKEGPFYAGISWFRVDRTLSTLVVVGLRPAGPVSVGKLGGTDRRARGAAVHAGVDAAADDHRHTAGKARR